MLLHAGVWWLPPLVLQLAAFVLSAAWGVLIYVISYFAWHSQPEAQAVSCCSCIPATRSPCRMGSMQGAL